jgi:hypothetical protein
MVDVVVWPDWWRYTTVDVVLVAVIGPVRAAW